jgi:hypothetical protein
VNCIVNIKESLHKQIFTTLNGSWTSFGLKGLQPSGDTPNQPNEISNISTLAYEVPREGSPDLEVDIHKVLDSHSTELTEEDLGTADSTQ